MTCPAWLPVDAPGAPCPDCGGPIENELVTTLLVLLVVAYCSSCAWTDTTAFERVAT